MEIQSVLRTINQMRADGIVENYAVGGAVGATFYLEPVTTLDVDIFVAFHPEPGALLVRSKRIFDYLTNHGGRLEGEYVFIGGWPVQFLPPTGPLAEEALEAAVEVDVEGTPARVFTAEHLAALALETGRAKDKARLLQFVEAGMLDTERFQSILARHGLLDRWRQFERSFFQP